MSNRLRAAALAAVVVALTAPSTGLAQTGANAQLVATGRQQFDDLRYEEAVQTLSAALLRRGNTPAQEVAIYELLGLAYLALNRDEESEGAFRLMLARDPEHALDAGQAPRVRDFYQAAVDRWVRDGRPGVPRTSDGARVERPVNIDHRSPAQHTAGVLLTLTAQITDPDRRAEALVLAYRAGSRGLFRRLRTSRSAGVFSAAIPPEEVRPPVVEYYLEAVDPRGIAVASRGDAFAPLRVVVPAAEATPITSRWWFWTGAAAVLAGVVVGTYFAVSGSSEPEPARLTITVRGE
ncbi:MAG: hypothetical protein Q8S73_42410 [Deltaproteobacteria bacterium]|nr:hypothetical protein [Myxococcales bacterium]MDP3220815.1 hypothetical protein [Deltaproteobacteria bacterium]